MKAGRLLDGRAWDNMPAIYQKRDLEHTAHQSRRHPMANNIRWGLDNPRSFLQ